MDVSNIELSGTVAQQKAAQTDGTPRPPLVPSEKNNAVPAIRKPRMREIESRYKSVVSSTTVSTPTAPRRYPSPNAARTSPTRGASLPKRSQSTEKRRPSTPTSRYTSPSSPSSRPSTPPTPASRSSTPVRDSVTEVHNPSRRLYGSRAHDGLWPSMRSLTTSFQSESISIPVSGKEKPARDSSPDRALKSSTNVGSERKRTPLRGRNTADQLENSRPVENLHTRVVEQHRWPGINGGKLPINSLSRSLDLTEKASRPASLPAAARGISPRKTLLGDDSGRGLQQSTSDVAKRLSDIETGNLECDKGTGVSASANPLGRAISGTHSNKTQSSQPLGLRRPSSPNKNIPTLSSTPRGTQSPSRTRPLHSLSSSSTPTVRAGALLSPLNNTVVMRKGKKSANQIEDAHQLRLLYNKNLQWCFVNALSEAVSVIQKLTAESTLYSVWNTILELRSAALLKRSSLQHLKEEMKLDLFLKEQMPYMEDWAALENEHSISLTGAIEALKASTLRLPVTGGARVDGRAVKNAVSSAVDVMQAMGSSVCYLLSKVENMSCMAFELSDTANIERAMLDECRDLLASTAAMQVQESSLRTQLVQLSQGPH